MKHLIKSFVQFINESEDLSSYEFENFLKSYGAKIPRDKERYTGNNKGIIGRNLWWFSYSTFREIMEYCSETKDYGTYDGAHEIDKILGSKSYDTTKNYFPFFNVLFISRKNMSRTVRNKANFLNYDTDFLTQKEHRSARKEANRDIRSEYSTNFMDIYDLVDKWKFTSDDNNRDIVDLYQNYEYIEDITENKIEEILSNYGIELTLK